MPRRGPPLLPEAPDGFLAPCRTPPRRERAVARAPFKARLPRLKSVELPGVRASGARGWPHRLVPPDGCRLKQRGARAQVLDMPKLPDDFYMNLMDWSTQNLLAVAISKSIYLWNAETEQACLPPS